LEGKSTVGIEDTKEDVDVDCRCRFKKMRPLALKATQQLMFVNKIDCGPAFAACCRLLAACCLLSRAGARASKPVK